MWFSRLCEWFPAVGIRSVVLHECVTSSANSTQVAPVAVSFRLQAPCLLTSKPPFLMLPSFVLKGRIPSWERRTQMHFSVLANRHSNILPRKSDHIRFLRSLRPPPPSISRFQREYHVSIPCACEHEPCCTLLVHIYIKSTSRLVYVSAARGRRETLALMGNMN